MTEANTILPLKDVIDAMRPRFIVSLEKSDLTNPEHLSFAGRLNAATADAGQVSIVKDQPVQDSEETVRSWVSGERGSFYFVQDKQDQRIGAVWSLADSHTEAANISLQKSGNDVALSSEITRHHELSSCFIDINSNDGQADIDATTLLLIEEFGLYGNNQHPVDTIAVYMDGPDKFDREMMNNLGFTISAEDVKYEGSDPCTVFIATKASVEQAIRLRAAAMGIVGSNQLSSALK